MECYLLNGYSLMMGCGGEFLFSSLNFSAFFDLLQTWSV